MNILNSRWDSELLKYVEFGLYLSPSPGYLGMRGYHNVIITYSNASAPREEWCLLLKSLSKCVAKVSKLFWCSNVTSWSEIATTHDNTQQLLTQDNLSPLYKHTWHLHQLERTLAILQSLGQVQNLSSEHRHLLLEHGAVIALVSLDRKDC